MTEAFITLSFTFLFRILYYAISEPSDSQNPQAIFKGWVTYLVERRGKGILETHVISGNDLELAEQRNDIWLMRLNKVMPAFTYELMLGVCPICTFWWYSLITIAIPLLIIGAPLLTVFFLYTTSQIINKILIKWI